MAYSTIKRKERICIDCRLPKKIFSHGRCYECSRRQRAELVMEESNIRSSFIIKKPKVREVDAELDRWFEEGRLEMTGICMNCGQPTCKYDDLYYRHSLSHILQKKDGNGGFPSVRTHPKNRLELCFWAPNSCHTNYDNGILKISEMSCRNIIIDRVIQMYPLIDEEERKNIPEILRQYLPIDL